MESHAPTEPLSAVARPSFAIVAQGVKRTVLAEQIFDYGPGQFAVISLDLPVTGHVLRAGPDRPFLGMGLTLSPAAIATLLLDAPTAARTDAAGIAVSDATSDLLDPIIRLLHLLDRPEDIPVLAGAIEREILWRLINGEQGATIRQIGLADSRLSQISRAIRRIRAGYAEPLRIEDLAKVAGMSVTSFHRHFRAVTAMSPLQFQKRIRLQEARTRLITDSHDVAAVGYAVGYDSPSQFSREYRRLFGAPPGRDASRLQALPPPDPTMV
ncbi:AraC family transcriptional regulator [Rugosimonospora africana]|uniref:AraC family transcriptional regulator n=2 Tax=Rugosimonospora africana TaxID=556532 RepID=A0A8J3VTP4_9ACTN|nr:AraC family transcriptional regulator [Rugosimonospora africana]